jgi:hypothetical protein
MRAGARQERQLLQDAGLNLCGFIPRYSTGLYCTYAIDVIHLFHEDSHGTTA